MKITVSVTNDLITDHRVHKVCTTLFRNGYNVKLIGRKFRSSQSVERDYCTIRMRLLFNRSVLFYAEYNIRLFFYLLFEKTDLFLSNDTDTLLANFFASKIRRKPLVFDAHEMFPEVPEVTNRKIIKAVWSKIEDVLFPKLKNTYTVCSSIADIYHEKYKMDMQVIRNIPTQTQTVNVQTPSIDAKGKKIILYQGAVNIGRGLEWIIDSMPYLDNFVFYIIGDGDILLDLKKRVNQLNLKEKVIFTGRVPLEMLSTYTVCADIGVNLLENKGLNYYYSLPNRIFDYIRAGIPVLTSDFPEIRRIVARYGIGMLVDKYEPQFLADTIKKLSVQGKNKDGFALANAELSWEKESETLLQVINKALKVREKEIKKITETCINKILNIDFNQLGISDYNRQYIQKIIKNINYYFLIYNQVVKASHEAYATDSGLIVDFGGGHGFLSLFLKSLGYRVIYCDINPLSVKTISLIKEELGFGPDYILNGSISELKQFCLDNNLKPKTLIAADLIEHIYDLQDFFYQLRQINSNIEMIFTTGSNPENSFKCRKLHRYMIRDEETYFQRRKDFIQSNTQHLTETEINTLVKLSRGKIYSDILKMLDSYQQTKEFPSFPDDKFNTCDPETGNWTERILSIENYKKFASEAGFQSVFTPGFYIVERRNQYDFLKPFFRLLNIYIRKSGKSGFKLAPFIFIKLTSKYG